jgi:hypothetical protein
MEIKMALTVQQKADQAVKNQAIFQEIAEMQRVQPALYRAICAYASAYKDGDTDGAFQAAGEVAGRVLALASGLEYVD